MQLKIGGKSRQINEIWILVVVLLIAGILRFSGIFSREIWYDEAIAILRARNGIASFIQGTLGNDPSGVVANEHPPGYFVLLWSWMKLFGESVTAARIFSILLGLFTVLVVYYYMKMFVSPSNAWVPVFFVAISPFHIHYSQEIRMYALMAFMLMVATLSMWKGMRTKKLVWWVIFGISSAVAQYSQHLAGIYLICLALVPLLKRDMKAVKGTFAGGLLAIFLYFPWLLQIPSQIASTEVFWIKKPLISRFLILFVTYYSGLQSLGNFFAIVVAGSMVVVAIGFIIFMRIAKNDVGIMDKEGLWLMYLAIVPPVLLWLIAQWKPVYLERALLASTICFSLYIGWLVVNPLTRTFERWILIAFLFLGFGIGFYSHMETSEFPYARFEELGNWLENNMGEGDLIVHSNKLSFVPMFYYFEDDLPMRFIADVESGATDTLRIPTQEEIGFLESESIEIAVDGGDGIWFIIFEAEIQEMEGWGVEEHPYLVWLEERYLVEELQKWDGLWVYYFQPFE